MSKIRFPVLLAVVVSLCMSCTTPVFASATAQSAPTITTPMSAGQTAGTIIVPKTETKGADRTVTIKGNGSTSVSLWFPASWVGPIVKNKDGSITIRETHATGQTITLYNVATVTYSNGHGFSIVDGACSSSNGATLASAPTAGLCSTGAPSTVLFSDNKNWTWSCAGNDLGSTAYCSALAAKACTDVNGTIHASRSSYKLQLSQTSGTTPATTAQCTYGGTQPP